ncbi:MAG: hypothetical protein IPL52_05435 [Flavobacteriales bacterium]|nr:hypothetical protein [Flavobacteriales bacterium]
MLTAEYHVISNVHDLVVNNPQAEAHEPLYTNGMWNENYKAVTTRADFVAFGEADALTDVLNLYLNISWTFPSYTDAVANVLSAFLDNGGNLMIAGQDIGWDQSGVTGAYGTPVTQAFYADYLHATYVADGSNADTQVLLGRTPMRCSGLLGNSTIIDAFGGNTYPGADRRSRLPCPSCVTAPPRSAPCAAKRAATRWSTSASAPSRWRARPLRN